MYNKPDVRRAKLLAHRVNVEEFARSHLVSTAFVADPRSTSEPSRNKQWWQEGTGRRVLKRIHRPLKKSFKQARKRAPFWKYFLQLLLSEPRTVAAQLALRSGNGLSGAYQWRRLCELRRILKRGSYASALELGSGASTLLFIKYCKNIVSVEESQEWASHYIQSLRSTRLTRSLAKDLEAVIIVAPRVEENDCSGERISRYQLPSQIAQTAFDLVYVDGPTNGALEPHEGIIRDVHRTLPNADVVFLAHPPKLILVDQRRATVAYISENLPPTYLVTTDLIKSFSQRGVYHTIFEAIEGGSVDSAQRPIY